MITSERVQLVNGACDLCLEPIYGLALGVCGYTLVLETTCIHGDHKISAAPEPFAYCAQCEQELGALTPENVLRVHRLVMLPLIMQIDVIVSYRISIMVDNLMYSDTP